MERTKRDRGLIPELEGDGNLENDRGVVSGYTGAGTTKSDAADNLDLNFIVPDPLLVATQPPTPSLDNATPEGSVTGIGVRVGVISDGIDYLPTFFLPDPSFPEDSNNLGEWPNIMPPYLFGESLVPEGIETSFLPRGAFAYRGIQGSGQLNVFNSGIAFRSFNSTALQFAATAPGEDINTEVAQTFGAAQGSEGGGMIEIVHDLAPYAEKFFSNLEDRDTFIYARNWLANEGKCDIVVDDVGIFQVAASTLQGTVVAPLDGSTPLPQTSDEIMRNGSLYITAAGNDSGETYVAEWLDTNGNGFHDFLPPDPLDPFIARDETLEINAGGGAFVLLSWLEPAGRAGDDLDISAFDPEVGPQFIVSESVTVQDGNDNPAEAIFFPFAGTYSIQVKRKDTTDQNPRPFHIRLIDASFVEINLINPANSYDTVASHRLGLSIGAVQFDTPSVLESFSARGQTLDRRLKPEMVAQDGVRVVTFENTPFFFGTSAAAPHVAGVAALALEQARDLGENPTPLELFDILRIAAIPNNGNPRSLEFGAGVLNAGNLRELDKSENAVLPVVDDATSAIVAPSVPGVGLTYWEDGREVTFDLSKPAVRNMFTTSQGDTLLESIFNRPNFGNVTVDNGRGGQSLIFDNPPIPGLPLDGVQVQGVDTNTFGFLVTPLIDFDMDIDGNDSNPWIKGTYLKMNRVYRITVNIACDDPAQFPAFRLRAEAAEFQNIVEKTFNPIIPDDIRPTTEGRDYVFHFKPLDRPALAGFRIAFDYFGLGNFAGDQPGYNPTAAFTIKSIKVEEIRPNTPL
jgi:hypothetical protein